MIKRYILSMIPLSFLSTTLLLVGSAINYSLRSSRLVLLNLINGIIICASSASMANPTTNGFADIVEPLMPTVVNVYTVQYPKQNNIPRSSNPFGNMQDPFAKFFEGFDIPFPFDETYTNPKAMSLGSGVIISSEGYIVTNHHVIANADEVNVKLSDNTELSAKVIGSDQRTDLALLKVESKQPLPFAKFGDSVKARVGDCVIAIGNPFGLGGTVTTGIVSSKGRDISTDAMGIVDDFIQTDAAINSGNSGGPMFNIAGEVIGINTAIFSPSGSNIGIGFAIPSTTASKVIEQLKEHGKISRGMLSIKIQDITPEIADAIDVPESQGVLVMEVDKGGTGDKAGIKPGDVIVKVGNSEVKNSRKLQIAIAETPVNTSVPITVMRDGKKKELKCNITEIGKSRKVIKDSGVKSSSAPGSSFESHGVVFGNITDDWLGYAGMPSSGVIVEQVKQVATWKGLMRGDLILSVNQMPVDSVDDVEKIVKKASENKKKHVILFVKRSNQNFVLALPL